MTLNDSQDYINAINIESMEKTSKSFKINNSTYMLKNRCFIVSVLLILISVLDINSQEKDKKGMEEMWGETSVTGDALKSGKAKL
uniref:hypothetical protein n=1 Tax=Winogradskyella costae TaxID=2697008 RepID=UPI0015CCB095